MYECMPLRVSDLSFMADASGTTRARFASSWRTPRPCRSQTNWAIRENTRYAGRSGSARTMRQPKVNIHSENFSRTRALLAVHGREGLPAHDEHALDDGHEAGDREQAHQAGRAPGRQPGPHKAGGEEDGDEPVRALRDP